MCACHTESLVCTCECPEHLGTLFYGESSIAEVYQLFVFGRYGRGIHDETRLWVAASVRYFVNVFFIVYKHALALQLVCEGRGCLVVACHNKALTYEITRYGTHANATGAYEIYGFYIFDFHFVVLFSGKTQNFVGYNVGRVRLAQFLYVFGELCQLLVVGHSADRKL